jgi:beta-N-acetylhexosaminidase
MAIAAAGDAALAGRVGYAMGCQLRHLGINMNFAPVLDVNAGKHNPIIGVRSFGDDPGMVAAFGAAMIGGMERAGIASVAKHFPGLGSAECDPHSEAIVIADSAEEMLRADLMPFARAVEAGVSGIMMSHARYPAFSDEPASLSEKVMRGLLRGQLSFGGLVITDDLEMGAVGGSRAVGNAAIRALSAGADLLLVCHSRAEQLYAMREVAEAIESKRIHPETIEDGMVRIRARKERLLASLSAQPDAPDEWEGLAGEVAERAITLASDAERVLPLRLGGGEKLLVILPALGPLTAAEDGAVTGDVLTDSIRAFHPMMEAVSFELVPSRDDFNRVLKSVEGAHAVVMGTCNAHLYGEQARLVKEVAGVGKPTVFIALRNPYDVELYPPRAAMIAAYGSDKHTLVAIAKAIFGELTPRGKLPVELKFQGRP